MKLFVKYWPRGCPSVLMMVKQFSRGTRGICDIHSFIKWLDTNLLSIYYVPGIILGAKIQQRTKQSLMELTFWVTKIGQWKHTQVMQGPQNENTAGSKVREWLPGMPSEPGSMGKVFLSKTGRKWVCSSSWSRKHKVPEGEFSWWFKEQLGGQHRWSWENKGECVGDKIR